jgi:hypothetical protein
VNIFNARLDNFFDITKLEASEYYCIPVTLPTSFHPTTTVPYFPHPKMGCVASTRRIHRRAELSRPPERCTESIADAIPDNLEDAASKLEETPAPDSRTTLGFLSQLPPLRPQCSVEVVDPGILSRILRFKSSPGEPRIRL